jgi:cell division protein FtsL
MIRPITCLAFLLACGSGLYLYQAKHRVKLLDDQIATVAKSTDQLREQTRMLSAEWTLLNDPERLRTLANQFLTLQTVSPNQFTSLSDLDGRLPPPAPPGVPPVAAAAAPVVAEQTPVPAGTTGTAGPDAAGKAGANAGAAAAAANVPAAPPPKVADAGPAKPPASVAKSAPPTMAHDVIAAARPAANAVAQRGSADAAPSRLATADQARADTGRASSHPPTRVALSQPHPPDQRPVNVHEVTQRTFIPRTAAARPVMAARMPQPMPSGGSFLGMAHDMAAPPVPMPMPMPQRPLVPYSGSGG